MSKINIRHIGQRCDVWMNKIKQGAFFSGELYDNKQCFVRCEGGFLVLETGEIVNVDRTKKSLVVGYEEYDVEIILTPVEMVEKVKTLT